MPSTESESLLHGGHGHSHGGGCGGHRATASMTKAKSDLLSQSEVKAIDSVLDETAQRRDREKRVLLAALVFCTFFMVVELVGGYVANSLAILTDATHLMTDVGAYALSIYALYAASRGACARYSYGWHRAEVIGTLVSIFSIWVLVAAIVLAAFHRMWNIYQCSRVDLGAIREASRASGSMLQDTTASKHAKGAAAPQAGLFASARVEGSSDGPFAAQLICEGIDAPIMVVVGVLGMVVNIICASILYFGGSHGHSHFGGAHGHSHGHGDHDDHNHSHDHSHNEAALESGYGSTEYSSHALVVDSGEVAGITCDRSSHQSARQKDYSVHGRGEHARSYIARCSRPSFSGLGHSHIMNEMYGECSSSSTTPTNHSDDDADERKHRKSRRSENALRLRREMRKSRGQSSGDEDDEVGAGVRPRSLVEGGRSMDVTRQTPSGVLGGDASLDDLLVDEDRPSSDNGTVNSEGEPVGGTEEAVAKNAKRKSGFALHAALLHALGDCVQSVGVILAGAFIYLANMASFGTHSYRFSIYNMADPVCSLVFAIVTINMTRSLLGDLLAILMESTPSGIDYDSLHRSLLSIESVESVHDLHVWSLSADYAALSVHLVAADPKLTLRKAQRICADRFGITHTTIQVDSLEDGSDLCGDPCVSPTLQT